MLGGVDVAKDRTQVGGNAQVGVPPEERAEHLPDEWVERACASCERLDVTHDVPASGPKQRMRNGYHARTDGFTSLAVVIGALGVWAGFDGADPIAGLVISVVILAVLRKAATDVLRPHERRRSCARRSH